MSEAYGRQTDNTATAASVEKPECKEYKIWQDGTMNIYISLMGLLNHKYIVNEFTISPPWPLWYEENEHYTLIHSTHLSSSILDQLPIRGGQTLNL